MTQKHYGPDAVPVGSAYRVPALRAHVRDEVQDKARDEDRAAYHHNITYEDDLRKAGVEEGVIKDLRKKFVKDALNNDDAVKQLRELYP